MTDKSKITVKVKVKGEDAMTGAVQVGAAMIDLIEAVGETMVPGGVKVSVVGMGWCCDRCGKQVGIERPDAWTREGDDDLCEECSK